MSQKNHLDTLVIHGNQQAEKSTGAMIPPIYLTSTYKQPRPGEPIQHDYQRAGNPTRAAYEAAMASIEGGEAGFAFSSGMAAISTILELLPAGSHILCAEDVYGGTFRLFDKVKSKSANLSHDFIRMDKIDTLEQHRRDNTRLLWLETPSNPLLNLVDIKQTVAWAKQHDIMVVCDNTFASPMLQNPLALGCDLVAHSASKYISGHSDVIGGVIVSPQNSPYSEPLHLLQLSIGAVASPFDSALAHRGLKTLALRMQRHCDNALALANWLEQHPQVKRVYYPGLASHPQHKLACTQMRGFGGMISFELNATAAQTADFVSNTKLFSLAESLGGVESLIELPASMTHASIPQARREALGISEQLIRLSVGIEYIDDLQQDLQQALKK